jgi:hypothetical protein
MRWTQETFSDLRQSFATFADLDQSLPQPTSGASDVLPMQQPVTFEHPVRNAVELRGDLLQYIGAEIHQAIEQRDEGAD